MFASLGCLYCAGMPIRFTENSKGETLRAAHCATKCLQKYKGRSIAVWLNATIAEIRVNASYLFVALERATLCAQILDDGTHIYDLYLPEVVPDHVAETLLLHLLSTFTMAQQGTPLSTQHEEHEAMAPDDTFIDDIEGSRHSQDSGDESEGDSDSRLEQELDAAEDAETLRKSQLEDYNSNEDDDCSTPVSLFHAGYSMVSFPVRTQDYPHTTHIHEAWRPRDSFPERAPAGPDECSVKPPGTAHSVLNRQPTFRRQPTEPKPDPNLVTWDENDPASPHSKYILCLSLRLEQYSQHL